MRLTTVSNVFNIENNLRDLPQVYSSVKLKHIQWPKQPSFNPVR